ncbi:m7GpppX diphosphatase [Thelohanellus kitauei]|uniref:m7GpppX diphosphatase n=1 Tax=Thelohanellus kitauei TaxID=669202 RepID=A0A0C2N116_THEKT|nr:m7GpppX diphosphatase [Thelohanellus kitauei]
MSIQQVTENPGQAIWDSFGSKLELVEILSQNVNSKSVADSGESVVIYAERGQMDSNVLESVIANSIDTKEIVKNPPFYKYEGVCVQPTPFNATVIMPATDDHIERYRFSKYVLVDESFDMYQKLSSYIQSQLSLNDWVYNILDGLTEVDRVLMRDDDFLIIADLKWNMVDKKSAYCLALTTRRDLYSLREMDETTLPILIKIRKAAKEIMVKKFGIEENTIQMFVHYHPSFYHFHVHIDTTSRETPGLYVGKAHFLDDIIKNIQLISNYYQKVDLKIRIPEKRSVFMILNAEQQKKGEDI